MQDRFKFRVWDKVDKKFMSGSVFIDCRKGAMTGNMSEDSYVIQQCTGLKDRNGKLIYEGDILCHPQLPHKVVCEWFQCGFWLNGYRNGAKRNLHDVCKFYEVIGNIYENKNLLEEQK